MSLISSHVWAVGWLLWIFLEQLVVLWSNHTVLPGNRVWWDVLCVDSTHTTLGLVVDLSFFAAPDGTIVKQQSSRWEAVGYREMYLFVGPSLTRAFLSICQALTLCCDMVNRTSSIILHIIQLFSVQWCTGVCSCLWSCLFYHTYFTHWSLLIL